VAAEGLALTLKQRRNRLWAAVAILMHWMHLYPPAITDPFSLCPPTPAADHAELDNKGVTAKLGELYKALTPEEKAPYEVGAAGQVGAWVVAQRAIDGDAGCLAAWLAGWLLPGCLNQAPISCLRNCPT
jgi:hypothetical protein